MNASEDQDFANVAVWLRSYHGICLVILLSATVLGNSSLLVLVLSNKTLQYRSVLVSLSLVVADLLMTVTWSTQGLANIIAGSCPFGEVGCSVLGTLTNIGIYARWCIIALITLERFCKILSPFYHTRCSKHLLITLSILCWAIPIATAVIPPLAGAGVHTFRLEYSMCIVTCDPNSGPACFKFYIVLYGFFITIGGILPMILYFMLCIVGHRKAYSMKHITLGTFRAAPTEDGGENAAVSPQLQSSEQDLKSNGMHDNAIPYSKPHSDSTSSGSSWGGALEKKILITFFMVFVNVFVTQLPIYTTSALRSSEEIYSRIPIAVHFVFVHIYLLGSVLDPLLIMRNRDFRAVITRRWRRRQAQRLQRNSTSMTHSTLFDFAKISSLLTVQPVDRTRCNSCPGAYLNTLPVRKLAKAISLDALDEEVVDTQIRIEEVEEEEERDGGEGDR